MTGKNAIEIYSTHNKGKSFVAEKFIRTLTLIRLGFMRVVFPGEGGVNLSGFSWGGGGGLNSKIGLELVLNSKVFRYMTSISKNAYIIKLDDIVNK